ncbi:MAG: hypothetical protein IPP34_19035 [Bacteroidetes bacterium]|nr:hypothetical protein [Bacteroidota bacterium]
MELEPFTWQLIKLMPDNGKTKRNIRINNLTMKTLIQILTVIIILLLQSTNVDAQARLTIENQSMRTMTVKVMKGYGDGGSLHKTVNISAYGSETIYFSESGYYYTKNKSGLCRKRTCLSKR